jgi:AcrR family transcriptional regulator
MNRPSSSPRKRLSKSPQDAFRSAYRDGLCLAAERVFAAKGFAATKMMDIASEAEVGVGTLYNYFASKQEIFEEIFKKRSVELEDLVDRAIHDQPPLEQIRQMLRVSLEYLENHAELFALYIERDAIGDTEIERLGGKVLEQRYVRFLNKLKVSIQAAVDAGDLTRDMPVGTLLAVLAGARNGAAYAWLKGSRQHRLTDMCEPILELFLSGARARR